MAITTLLEVANRALVRLGAKEISSLNEDTDRALACRSEMEECRLETLTAYPWNFARKRMKLSALPVVSLTPSADALTEDATATFTAGGDAFVVGQDEGMRIIADTGIARIETVTDTTTVTATVETAFDSVAAISAGDWRMAPGWEWDFRFPKPTGYLRLYSVEPVGMPSSSAVIWSYWKDAHEAPEPVRIEDQFLVSNLGPTLNIAFTRDIEDVAKWDSLSKSALSALLAFRICYAVTGSLQAARTQHDSYMEILSSARTSDSQENRAPETLGSDILVTIRRS